MFLRYYTNAISAASRSFAKGLFVTGLLLIGFGFLVYVLRELFAILFAIVFCVAGLGCVITAVKVFFAQRKLNKINSKDSQVYRENVQIRATEHHDVSD